VIYHFLFVLQNDAKKLMRTFSLHLHGLLTLHPFTSQFA